MPVLRSVVEIGIGLLYAAGAVFNTAYTLRHHTEFYGSFADGAWLGPSRWLVRNVVIPSGKLFTVLLIVFQAVIAIGILTRGDSVAAALLAGGVFSLVAALFSSPAGTAGTLVLAAIQFALALSR